MGVCSKLRNYTDYLYCTENQLLKLGAQVSRAFFALAKDSIYLRASCLVVDPEKVVTWENIKARILRHEINGGCFPPGCGTGSANSRNEGANSGFHQKCRAAPKYRLYAYRADFHCNEARIIAKVSARRESLHLFDNFMTQLKSGQFTVPTHRF